MAANYVTLGVEFTDLRAVNETRSSYEIRGYQEMAQPAVARKHVGDECRSAYSSVIERKQEPPIWRGLLVGDEPRGFQSAFGYRPEMPFEFRAINFVNVRIWALKPTEIETPLRNDIVKK